MRDLIVIGGGPAGLAAMSYALTKQLDAVLICTKLGGRAGTLLHPPVVLEDVASDVEAAVDDLVARLRLFCTVQHNLVIDDLVTSVSQSEHTFQVVTERNNTLSARAVLLATGAQARGIGVPHERELIGHGLGYSITTHANTVTGRSVAVVGATMRALRGVAELTETALRVSVIAPDAGELESELGRSLCAHPTVEVLKGYQVQAIEASHQQIQAITVARGEDIRRIAVQAVFADLGLVPNSQMVRHLVQLDTEGRVLINHQYCTSVPGVFAVGDVSNDPSEQILVAMGAGVRAARNAYAYILEQRLHNARLHWEKLTHFYPNSETPH